MWASINQRYPEMVCNQSKFRLLLWNILHFPGLVTNVTDNYKSVKVPLCCFVEVAMATHSSTLAWKIPWSLVGYSPWGREESDMTEQLHFHFLLLCIGEGNGNPLQCSCLENPRHRGAWWAAVCGVAQSQTQLMWLSSSSRMLFWINGS